MKSCVHDPLTIIISEDLEAHASVSQETFPDKCGSFSRRLFQFDVNCNYAPTMSNSLGMFLSNNLKMFSQLALKFFTPFYTASCSHIMSVIYDAMMMMIQCLYSSCHGDTIL